MQQHNKLLDTPLPEVNLTARDIIIRGAAETLMGQQDTAAAMAGVQTAKFVQSARREYLDAGFDFTDDELRLIHECLRELVVRKMLGGNYKALNLN